MCLYIVPCSAPSPLPAIFHWHLMVRGLLLRNAESNEECGLGSHTVQVQIPVLPLTSHVNLGRQHSVFVSEFPWLLIWKDNLMGSLRGLRQMMYVKMLRMVPGTQWYSISEHDYELLAPRSYTEGIRCWEMWGLGVWFGLVLVFLFCGGGLFWPHSQHMEDWQPMLQLQQCWILNPLCQARDRTHTTQRHYQVLNLLCHRGNSPERCLSNLSNITQVKWDKAMILIDICPPNSRC